MTSPTLQPADLAHARFAVGLVTAAREGFDAFLDGCSELLADVEDNAEHPLHERFQTVSVQWWLVRMVLAFAQDATRGDGGDDPVGEMIRGWAVGISLPPDDETVN